MTWMTVVLLALGAFFVLGLLYLLMVGLVMRKSTKMMDKFMKDDDDFFNRRG